MPLPEDDAYAALAALATRLVQLRAILTNPQATVVRLVSIPERVVIDETRSAFTLLSLFGLCVNAVVLNRVPPARSAPGSEARGPASRRAIKRAEEQFATAPLSRCASARRGDRRRDALPCRRRGLRQSQSLITLRRHAVALRRRQSPDHARAAPAARARPLARPQAARQQPHRHRRRLATPVAAAIAARPRGAFGPLFHWGTGT